MFSALASSPGLATRGRSLVGVALLALALPAFAVRAWSSAHADTLGNGIAAWLIAVVPTPPPVLAEASPGGPEELEPPSDGTPGVRSAAIDAKRPHQPARARAAALSGIRISSAQVLALAARRAMPNAVFVKANAQRPAGLLLSSVSALGVGLRDGDVLTEAAGQKASSVAVVVGVVLAARARQASEISGRFYRGAVPFSVTVEQPYPKGPVPG
ncbi:MAG: hypothetical protein WDO69_01550 [Pseudomonadota bacterium]